jgi:DNA-binding transcriptional LysR family regulator
MGAPRAPIETWYDTQMEQGWLLDFIALARTKSFTEAAKSRNSSQSAFSRRIQLLEYWLNVRLVDRAVQPVALTAAGTKFLPMAESLCSNIDEIKKSIN